MSRKKAKKGSPRLTYVTDFYALEYSVNKETGELDYQPSAKIGSKPFPRFPVLIKGNGEPWTLGNLHLTHKLMARGRYKDQYVPKTWANWATNLLTFLRWLEETDTDPLKFHPVHEDQRPTYRFRSYLEELMEKKRRSGNLRGVGLSASTAGEIHGTVQAFYRTLTQKGVITPTLLGLAWKDVDKLVKLINYDLTNTAKLMRVKSSDQAVKRTKKKQDPTKVEGKLRPLTQKEQDVIDKFIAQSGITVRLIFTVARCTGARLQTICTLRGSTIKNAVYNAEEDHYLIHVGGTSLSLVDTKGKKEETLILSPELHNLLMRYWSGNIATSRRIQSAYGNTLDNYLFLHKNSAPYYSSRQEINDARDPNYHRGVTPVAATKDEKRKIDGRKGQGIKTYIKDTLLPRIRNSDPKLKHFDFSFHDLRATFGMNTLFKLMDDEGINSTDALLKVCDLMNHSGVHVTTAYLDFKRYKGDGYTAHTQLKIETRLLQKVPDDVMNYNYE